MPYSSKRGKAVTAELFKGLNVKTVLDIGAGSGTYKKLADRVGALQKAKWTALEVWEPYIERFKLNDLYDEVILQDARQYLNTNYEMVICGDVLEHMTKDEAFTILDRYKNSYRLVSVPTVHYPQGEHEGNPYEKHVEEDWNPEWIADRYKDELIGMHPDNGITVYLLCPQKP